MYGIFIYIWLILMTNVGEYSSPMDPMGFLCRIWNISGGQDLSHQLINPQLARCGRDPQGTTLIHEKADFRKLVAKPFFFSSSRRGPEDPQVFLVKLSMLIGQLSRSPMLIFEVVSPFQTRSFPIKTLVVQLSVAGTCHLYYFYT